MPESHPYPIPENEEWRLKVLRESGILDTSPEEQYDDLLRLTAEICQVPIASITLIDEARQWFKARIGFDVTETSRDTAFCAHTICEPENTLLIIPDATQDRRFSHYSNVTGAPYIRFYAGAPLVTRDGAALGSLCVIDRRPRNLDEAQARALRIMGRHVVNALELRRLVRLQEQSIDRLKHTQAELEAARQATEDAAAAKSRFLAAVTHELRTPLNAIIGMTTLLADAKLEPVHRDCAETIRSSGEILSALVNDILDFSKIESGHLKLSRAPFNLSTCLARSLDCLRGAARTKGLSLDLHLAPDVPVKLLGDVTRIQQILVNLLANAIKFTSRGGVTVTVKLAQETAAGLPVIHFTVTDTGIGIEEERIKLLFQDYAQADNSISRRFGGTGLGLSISKRLAELQGGRIWVESVHGQGSSFHFTITAQLVPDSAAVVMDDPAKHFGAGFGSEHPLSILVADDNPINRKVAGMFLRRLGYQPTFASDGVEAVEAVKNADYDLVMMDVEMPRLDGLGATQRIRTEVPLGQQPLIVALTAHPLEGEHGRLIKNGMDDFLAKPIREDQLVSLLLRISGKRT